MVARAANGSARVEVDSAARVTVVWAETGSRSVVRSSQWVIDGEKALISRGDVAGLFVVWVKFVDDPGPSSDQAREAASRVVAARRLAEQSGSQDEPQA